MAKILHIEVDEVSEVNEFIEKIRSLSVPQQLARTREFVQGRLKNAAAPANEKLPAEEQEKIRQVFDAKPRKLSESLKLGYGACLEYHVLSFVVLLKLNIPCEFKGGAFRRSRHTYLDVMVNGKWQIFDPYAEVYLRDEGKSEKLLDRVYYLHSNTRKQKPKVT